MPSFASDPFVYLRQRAIRGGGSGGAVVAPVLGPLTLTPNTASLNSPYSGTVTGKSAGSTLSLSGPGAVGLSVVGATVSGTPTVLGLVDIVEMLAGADNSPRTSSGVLTVADAPSFVAPVGFARNGAPNSTLIAAMQAVKAGTGNGANVVIKGDSTSVGQGAGTATNFLTGARMLRPSAIAASGLTTLGVRTIDRAVVGSNRMNVASQTLSNYDGRASQGPTSVLDNQNFAGGGAFQTQGSGLALTVSDTDVDRFEIVFFNATAGTFSFLIDGVAPAFGPSSVNVTNALGFTTVTVGAATAGNRTLTISASAAGMFIRSVMPFKSTAPSLNVINHAALGVQSAAQAASGSGWSNKESLLRDAPCLTIIALGLNDMNASVSKAAWKPSIQTIITDAKISGDVLLVSPLPASGGFNTNIADYRAACVELAAANSVSYLDIWDYFGGYTGGYPARTRDGVHPDTGLYAEIGTVLRDAVRAMVVGSGVFPA